MSDRMYDFLLNLYDSSIMQGPTSLNHWIFKTRSPTYHCIDDFLLLAIYFHTFTRSETTLQVRNVFWYDGYGPGRGNYPVRVLVALIIYAIADIFRRYESIKTVTKPTEKQEGQLGGWLRRPSSRNFEADTC